MPIHKIHFSKDCKLCYRKGRWDNPETTTLCSRLSLVILTKREEGDERSVEVKA